jgi:hypothetical protein
MGIRAAGTPERLVRAGFLLRGFRDSGLVRLGREHDRDVPAGGVTFALMAFASRIACACALFDSSCPSTAISICSYIIVFSPFGALAESALASPASSEIIVTTVFHREKWILCMRRARSSHSPILPFTATPGASYVRFGSLADILTSPRLVRFTPNHGRWAAHPSQHLAVGL